MGHGADWELFVNSPNPERRYTIRTCEYPGCELIEQDGRMTHSHPHRTQKWPPYTETPLSEPIEVIPTDALIAFGG